MTRRNFARGISIAAWAAAAACAQTISAVNGTLTATLPAPMGAAGGFVGSFIGGGPLNGIKGQPLSAQQETQTIQTLADGTHITNGVQKVTYYRDSLGRTRTERTAMQPPGFLSADSTPPVFIEVVDPVAEFRYSFDSNSHTAHRMPLAPQRIVKGKVLAPNIPVPPLAPPPATAGRVVVSAQRPHPEMSNEPLGTQTIEGVLAQGVRTTTTYPVGFFGNDRPITVVSETWNSSELGMPVLTKMSDPRNGETTMKLTNISRSEPSLSLFEPPAGYEIVDPPAPAEQR